MGEGWIGVCAKVHMWRSAGGHLWGVGSLLSPLVLRRCDLAKCLPLPRRPLPLTPALFVSHGLPFSKVPPVSPYTGCFPSFHFYVPSHVFPIFSHLLIPLSLPFLGHTLPQRLHPTPSCQLHLRRALGPACPCDQC